MGIGKERSQGMPISSVMLPTRLIACLQMTNHSFIIRKVNDEYDSRGHTKVPFPVPSSYHPLIPHHSRNG